MDIIDPGKTEAGSEEEREGEREGKKEKIFQTCNDTNGNECQGFTESWTKERTRVFGDRQNIV